jgi:alkylation response protein AidB-like acyl-CoA dehydrogenase
VRVPVENLVGKENKGWTYAKFLLGTRAQRASPAWPARSAASKSCAKSPRTKPSTATPLILNGDFARKISQLEIDLTALEFTELRTLASRSRRARARVRKARSSRSRAPKSSSA